MQDLLKITLRGNCNDHCGAVLFTADLPSELRHAVACLAPLTFSLLLQRNRNSLCTSPQSNNRNLLPKIAALFEKYIDVKTSFPKRQVNQSNMKLKWERIIDFYSNPNGLRTYIRNIWNQHDKLLKDCTDSSLLVKWKELLEKYTAFSHLF